MCIGTATGTSWSIYIPLKFVNMKIDAENSNRVHVILIRSYAQLGVFPQIADNVHPLAIPMVPKCTPEC